MIVLGKREREREREGEGETQEERKNFSSLDGHLLLTCNLTCGRVLEELEIFTSR